MNFGRIVLNSGQDFGLCLSTHRDWVTAYCGKAGEKKYGWNGVAAIESPEGRPFKKGETYAEVASAKMAQLFDQNAIALLIKIEEAKESGGDLDALAKEVELFDMTLAQLIDRYGQAAQEKRQADAQAARERAEQQSRVQAVGNALAEEFADFTYAFPAVSGIQASKEYYVAQVPYRQLVRLFTFDDEELVPPQLRAQRKLNETRAEAIGDYMLNNTAEYVLPSITASVDQSMRFEPYAPGQALGQLRIPMDATLLINDGQHRRRGIEKAIKKNPRLKDETIAVVIYFDQGLQRSQQMFADINNNQVKPSSALNLVYNHRDPFAAWIKELLQRPGMRRIADRIDMERSSVAATSSNLWSIVAFKKFIERFFGVTARKFPEYIEGRDLEDMARFVELFLGALGPNLQIWQAMLEYSFSAPEVREKFVCGHAVFLEALGMLAYHLVESGRDLSDLEGLKAISVGKQMDYWQGRCVVNGKMNKTTDGVKLTAAQLCEFAGVALPPELAQAHEEVKAAWT